MLTPLRLRTIAALLMIGAAAPSFAAGTGMTWQVPNEPTGKFSQPGAPGLCQCIDVKERLQVTCLSSAVICLSQCGHMYSYMPDARQSCGPKSNTNMMQSLVRSHSKSG